MDNQLKEEQIDLTNCDREPIHLLGKVQSHGAIMVLSSDWILNNASKNLDKFCPSFDESKIGCLVGDLFRADALSDLRSAVNNINDIDHSERLYGLKLFHSSNNKYDCAIHFSGESLIVEIEPHDEKKLQLNLRTLRRALADIGRCTDLDSFYNAGAHTIAELLNFDRVMVYKFHNDDSGEVIGECLHNNVDSFMGLRYPASDIPKQARELYLRNLTRMILDINDPGCEFYIDEPVDLSVSTLRTVSPMHIEYLKNMGIHSSLSISIIIEGKLWGLFACHNYSANYVSLEQRSVAEVFAESFSLELSSKLLVTDQVDLAKIRNLHMKMMATQDGAKTIFQNLKPHVENLKELIDCHSLVLALDDEHKVAGMPVSQEDIRLLCSRLNRMSSSDIVHTDNLAHFMGGNATVGERYAGLLAIPITRRPRDYLIFLRKEEPKSVTWAGNPEKPVELGPNGSRLTPRKSFAAWQELRHGYSATWQPVNIIMASQIKQVLLEIIVRNVDERDRLANEARTHQDLLIHELNHRVRNILGLIGSVVSQTAGNVTDVEEFRHVLGGRIHALADAQNQLTERNWSFAPLKNLIEVSLGPYSNSPAKRSIQGPDVEISPKAYTTMTLVVHELVTNAVKYGALNKPNAQLTIDWYIDQKQNSVILKWSERGVLIENFPRQRGFGSIIIERSVPHDLGGKADIAYGVDGLDVTLYIPLQHVSYENQSAKALEFEEFPVTELSEASQAKNVEDMNVLLVEDNMIIALDLEVELQNFGFGNVYMASNVHTAMQLMNKHTIDIAVLDINLGVETSFGVAKELQKQNKPFLFLTGYSELRPDAVSEFHDVPILSKPLNKGLLNTRLQMVIDKM